MRMHLECQVEGLPRGAVSVLFSAAALLRPLAARGAGVDVVSGGELRAALRAGFPSDRIVFSGVGKTAAEIALGVDEQIGAFNAESEEEITHIAAAAAATQRRAAIALRVNPDVDARSHPYISTGLKESKFGVDIAVARDVLRRASRLPALEVVGIQCHIGSQILDLSALEEAAHELVALARSLAEDGLALRHVDLGGGLGVDYDGSRGPSPADLAARVLPILAPLGLTVMVEPGRSLVARAGVLLTQVLYVKQTAARTFVIVDAGMNDLVRPALYEAFHRVEPVIERGRPPLTVDVVGPVCESSDFLARERVLEAVQPGDLLAVRDAGAYGFSMASNYNLRLRPAEVVIEDGQDRLVRRRETFDDLVATEV